MDNRQITNIRIKGFKSIKNCDLNLGNINIFIGSNGSGKSNFISVFKMLQSIVDGELQLYVNRNGGPNSLMYFGSKTTEKIDIEFKFGNNGYRFALAPTLDGKLMFLDESFLWNSIDGKSIGKGHLESNWKMGCGNLVDNYVLPILKNQEWKVYHFHDTGDKSPIKQAHGINDNISLSTDAHNLAAFLYRLKIKNPADYRRIVDTVKMVAPYFDDFILRPNPLNENTISLEWKESGSDIPFNASQLSDGTLRFICLATLLLQPSELMPETIIIDEPELGLHPYAIAMMSALIKKVSVTHQVIVSTQSVELLDEFSADDIIVVNHGKEGSEFVRLNEGDLRIWIEDDYTLGDLWKMNILGGRP